MTQAKEYIQSIAALDQLGRLGIMEAGYQDDLCDCLFVNVWEWKNPYTATTLRFRFCCWLTEQRKANPTIFEELDTFNGQEPMPWDGEGEMPRHLWYRRVARQTGQPLAQVRIELRDQIPPQGVPRMPESKFTLPKGVLARINQMTAQRNAIDQHIAEMVIVSGESQGFEGKIESINVETGEVVLGSHP